MEAVKLTETTIERSKSDQKNAGIELATDVLLGRRLAAAECTNVL